MADVETAETTDGQDTSAAGALDAGERIGMLGRKLGMTQILDPRGRAIAVTVIELGPCVVVQRKTPDRDGYTAVQLGFSAKKESRATKAAIGHAKKAGKGPFQLLREFRGGENFEVGRTLRVTDMFSAGDRVHVTGTTKGRGFAGVIRRHGFGGFPGGHGTHEYFRHGGSIGNRSFPGRVFKGRRMAGQFGNDRVTTRNLSVVQVRGEQNLLLVAGAVAGSRGGYVEVRPVAEVV
ncbi:MAG: 50S ribosomal protein L3 [Deltaproteobacteria bacterium]|nr:50S ribosomal protein L3 [Deltaproteobacteria bacterium]